MCSSGAWGSGLLLPVCDPAWSATCHPRGQPDVPRWLWGGEAPPAGCHEDHQTMAGGADGQLQGKNCRVILFSFFFNLKRTRGKCEGGEKNQDFAHDVLYLECETNVLLLSLYLFIDKWTGHRSQVLTGNNLKKKKAQLRHCWTSLHHLLWMGSKRKTLQKTVGAQKEAWWKLEAHSSVNEIKINLFIPWLVWSTEVSALRECKKCLGGWLLQMTLGVTVDGAQYWMTRWLAVSRTESGKLDEDSKRSEREGERKEKWKLWGILKRKVEECNTSRKEPLRGCFWRRAEHVSGWRGFSLISKTTVAVCVWIYGVS